MSTTTLKALGLMALVAASAPALGQVYKTTDPSGKVQYSDRPPSGTVLPAAADDQDRAFSELQGTWSVANATMNGTLYDDPKIAGATWSFRSNELLLEQGNGEKGRYTVRIEIGARPKAFYVTPVPPFRERGGWMIYARDGMRLRIAFMENMEGRPTAFERQPRQVGVVLVAQIEAAPGKGLAAGDEPRACKILRTAGVMDLLGPTAAPSTVHQSATHCRFEQPMGSATLSMRLDTNRSALDREREGLHKQALRSAHVIVRDEPELGPSAFSVTRGSRLTVYLLKGETIFVIDLELPAGSQTNRTTFVRRVIAEI